MERAESSALGPMPLSLRSCGVLKTPAGLLRVGVFLVKKHLGDKGLELDGQRMVGWRAVGIPVGQGGGEQEVGVGAVSEGCVVEREVEHTLLLVAVGVERVDIGAHPSEDVFLAVAERDGGLAQDGEALW
jgi:hypothetical protein